MGFPGGLIIQRERKNNERRTVRCLPTLLCAVFYCPDIKEEKTMGVPISGKGGKVMLGSVTVANIKEWSISGFTMGTLETTAFGTTIKTFIEDGTGDPGTVSFSGNYDPGDTTGQAALATLCEAGTTSTDLYLYANTSTFWRVGAAGNIITTKAKAVSLPRTGLGSVSFEGKVSGAAMEQVGTGT